MFFSEEELPIEVGVFDVIGICERDLAIFSSAEADHGEVFQELASDGSCSDHEEFGILKHIQ